MSLDMKWGWGGWRRRREVVDPWQMTVVGWKRKREKVKGGEVVEVDALIGTPRLV